MAAQLTEQIRNRLDWLGVKWASHDDSQKDGREVRLLDYACGTGMIARVRLLTPSIRQASDEARVIQQALEPLGLSTIIPLTKENLLLHRPSAPT